MQEYESKLIFWEIVIAVAVVVVIIGIALEGSELFVKWAKKRSFRQKFEQVKRVDVILGLRWIRPRMLGLETAGFLILVAGLGFELLATCRIDLIAHQQNDEIEREISGVDPMNLPIMEISAYAKLNVKGTALPELKNWGQQSATMMLCQNDLNSSSFPELECEQIGGVKQIPDWNEREYFLKFQLNTVDATMALPLKNLASSIQTIKTCRIDARFLPPQSEILNGYVLLHVNNSIWQLFHFYPQKDNVLNSVTNLTFTNLPPWAHYTVPVFATNASNGGFDTDWWK